MQIFLNVAASLNLPTLLAVEGKSTQDIPRMAVLTCRCLVRLASIHLLNLLRLDAN